jgi:hypothetical protein
LGGRSRRRSRQKREIILEKKKTKRKRTGGMAHVEENLPGNCEALISISRASKNIYRMPIIFKLTRKLKLITGTTGIHISYSSILFIPFYYLSSDKKFTNYQS